MLIHDVLPACFPIYFHFGKRMVKQPVLFCTDIVPHCTNIKILFPSFIPHNYGDSPINRTFRTIPFSGPVGILLGLRESVVFATIFPTSGKWLWGNMKPVELIRKTLISKKFINTYICLKCPKNGP